MIRYLTRAELLRIHQGVLEVSGGGLGIRDPGGLDASLAQPRMTFAGEDLYLTVPEKGAALAFSLANNHPFVDGNKRVSHAAMETFLLLNGYELKASVDEQERMMLALAGAELCRDEFTRWIQAHVHLSAGLLSSDLPEHQPEADQPENPPTRPENGV